MRYFLLAAFCSLFFVAHPAAAALLYLDPGTATIGKGENTVVAVRLNTDADHCINAVDGVLIFDEQLQITDVSTGNSIFPIWVEKPTFDNDAHTLTFAGGIPNGYCGRVAGDPRETNTLLEIVLRSPNFTVGGTVPVPEQQVAFTEQTTAYLNDGQGTPLAIDTLGATISVTNAYAGTENDPWTSRVQADTEAPGEFSIILSKEESAFHGKYFITFNTADKQTGIDHYEVIEEPLDTIDLFSWGAATAPWERVTSPYVLQDQSLNSVIRVKAIDKAGNEYVATLVPDRSLRSLSTAKVIFYATMGVVIGGSLLLLLLLVRIVRRRREVGADPYADEEGVEYDDTERWHEDEPSEEVYGQEDAHQPHEAFNEPNQYEDDAK